MSLLSGRCRTDLLRQTFPCCLLIYSLRSPACVLVGLDVFEHNLHEAFARGRACPGNVRSDVAVTGREQWIVGTGRLLREYVYAGGIDGAVVKCIGKVLFVDERAASGIDEDGGGLHQSEPFCIYHLAGGVGEGTVQADDVTFAEQLVQLHLADFGRKLEVGLGGVAHASFQSRWRCVRGKTGVAQAYDTNFLSAQFDEWSVPEQKSLLVVQLRGALLRSGAALAG